LAKLNLLQSESAPERAQSICQANLIYEDSSLIASFSILKQIFWKACSIQSRFEA
jgi:hypothetical protein